MKTTAKRWVGVVIVALLTGTTAARAETIYDVEDFGEGNPVALNSIGTVLFQDGLSTLKVIAPDGTQYATSVLAGWDFFSYLSITDPILPAAPLGIVWGGVWKGSSDEASVFVWNPSEEITEASVPSGGRSWPVGVVDGWLYATSQVEGEPATVFACSVEDPGTRVDAPSIDGNPAADIRVLGPDAHRVLLRDGGAPGRTVLWSAASDAFTDLGGAIELIQMNEAGEAIDRESFWSAAGERTSLPFAPTSLSNGGWVIGYGPMPGRETLPTAFVWHEQEGLFDLTDDIVDAGGSGAVPLTVTDDGMVVGEMWTYALNSISEGGHPFVWDLETGFVDLSPDLGENVSNLVVAVGPQGRVFYSVNDDFVVTWQRIDGIPESLVVPMALNRFSFEEFETVSAAVAAHSHRFTNELGQYLFYGYGNGHVVLATPRGITRPGADVEVEPDANTSITFDGIVTPGETTVVAYDIDDPDAPTVPADFALSGTGALINISTTATFTGSVELAIRYDQGTMPEDGSRERQIRLLHFVDPQWVDVTDYARPGGFLDKVNNVVYGRVTSFSPFAVVEALDSAAPVISSVSDVSANASSTLGAVVTFSTPTANDAVDGAVSVTCSPASGTLFPVGVTTVTCTAVDAVQNVATKTFDVVVRIDPYYLKGAVATALNSLIATSDKATVKRLLKAIRDIEDSLASDLWVDDFHLTAKGHRVFQEESTAVAQLLEIASPVTTVTQAIASLVEADRALAEKAIEEATAVHPDSSQLATAASEMDLATSASSAGSYRDAIKHYRKAWRAGLAASGT